MIARLRLLWQALRRRREFEAQLRAELLFHEQACRDDLLSQGLTPAEAARRARIALGMRELHRHDCRRARGLAWIDSTVGDLRHAWRGLRRNPGFGITAVLVLGSAIAANAVLFALFNAYALRYPPIERAERWVTLQSVEHPSQLTLDRWNATEAEQLMHDPPAIFEGLYWLRDIRLTVVAEVARPAFGEAVSTNYFELIGVRAARGRTFRSGEEGGVILSDTGWRRLLDADAQAIGRKIDLAGHPFTVIGVTPPEFSGLTATSSMFWITEHDLRDLRPDEFDANDAVPRVDVGGFLREGASAQEAAAALATRNAGRPQAFRLPQARVELRRGYMRQGDVDELLWIATPVGIAFAVLLLVAAANLASLLLARLAARRKELAVRCVVGAPPRRLLAQLFAESLLVAVAAALFGFALAATLIDPLHRSMTGVLGEASVELRDVGVDTRVFLYALGLALMAALTFGGAPAWRVTMRWRRVAHNNVDMASMLRAGHSRLRSVLMVAQLAASLVLLVVASLIAANARLAEQVALGYDPEQVVALTAMAPDASLRDAMLAVPQVSAAATAARAPLMADAAPMDAVVGERSMPLRVFEVQSTYFDVLGVARLHGRKLHRSDEGGRVVAISRRTAERLWPGRNAIGERIHLPPQKRLEAGAVGSYEVGAVVEDVVSGLFVEGFDTSAMYVLQPLGARSQHRLLLRVRDNSLATRDAIARACVRARPDQMCEGHSLGTVLRMQKVPFVVAANAAGALGWTALAISCIGLYGLVSFLVQQKRRELGVRLALGATASGIVRLVLSQASRLILLGLAVGLPLAFALSRVVARQTDKLHTFDWVSFALVPAILVALVLLAAWVPARRTAGIAPTEALREE